MSESEDDVITELGDEVLELDKTTDTMMVFRLRLPDANVALGTINIMFRGDESVMEAVKDVFLCVIVNDVPIVIGTTVLDPDMNDVRILLVKEWKRSLPLPLAGISKRLAVVVHHTGDLSSRHVKFGADVVKCMDALRDVKWKKTSGDTVLHFRNHMTRIETGIDCLRNLVENVSLEEVVMRPPESKVVPSQSSQVLQSTHPSQVHQSTHPSQVHHAGQAMALPPIPRVFSDTRIPWNF